jgi:hypothetical protein
MKAFAVYLVLALFALPARAKMISSDSSTNAPSKSVIAVGQAASDLRKESADPRVTDDQLHQHAQKFADGIIDANTIVDFKPYQATDWRPKEWKDSDYTRTGDIAAMESAFEGALLGAREPPDPAIMNAMSEAKALRSKGQLDFGDVPDNVAGECVYRENGGAIRITLNQIVMQLCGLAWGDRICGAIPYAHEGDHCYKADQHALHPDDIVPTEVAAFHTEAQAIRRVANPYELSVLLANFGPMAQKYNPFAASLPKPLVALTKHFGEMLMADDKQNLPTFVTQLGYVNQDRHGLPAPTGNGPTPG